MQDISKLMSVQEQERLFVFFEPDWPWQWVRFHSTM